MPGRVIVPKTLDFPIHPWTGWMNPGTANGVQYTTPFNSAASNTWAGLNDEINSEMLIPADYTGGQGKLRELLYGITVAFKTDNGDAELQWKLQGKNYNAVVGGRPVSWVDLSDTLVQARPFNTAFYDNSVAGYAPIGSNFNAVPFQLRVVFSANTAGNIQCKIKNSSYIKFLYTMS
jgi:hypothetical protein